MKKYISMILIFVTIFMNVRYVDAATVPIPNMTKMTPYGSIVKGQNYAIIYKEYQNIVSGFLFVGLDHIIKEDITMSDGRIVVRYTFVDKDGLPISEKDCYYSFGGADWKSNNNQSFSIDKKSNDYIGCVEQLMLYTVPITDNNGKVIEDNNTDVVDSIDIGYTNYNDTVTSSNSVYDTGIPYIKNFKVVKTKGSGALAHHNLTWLSSEELKQMRVEVALAYKVEASDSWFLNKKYNEGFVYYRTYSDGLLSSREILNIPLSTSNPDGTFKDSVATCIVGDLKKNFGDKEAMAIINATESNLKAYYIRNVVYKDGKYHYSQWVRCKVGSSYSVGHGGVVDEDGMKYEDKEDYPVDPNGNPEYDADGGRGESGFAILDFLYGVFDSITGIFTAFVDGVGIVMEGVGKLPSAFGKIFGALPEPVSVVFVMGMMICVFMRFLKR